MFEIFKRNNSNKMRKKTYRDSFKQKYTISDFYPENYNNPSEIDIITVSFNAPKLIKYQIRLMKKFLVGNYCIIICDNSTEEKSSIEIRNICKKIMSHIFVLKIVDNPMVTAILMRLHLTGFGKM